MQEHPIPQDITSYRFHIIGSMTLKQFGEILLGVIIAFIIYSTNLISVIKWPLVLLSVGLGAAAAFVPIEERPLDHWIITFFKVMYKPTKFFWKRTPHIPEPFTFESRDAGKKQEPTLDLTPVKKQRIKEYIQAVPNKPAATQDFTQEELSRMQDILGSFTSVQVPEVTPVSQPKTVAEKPRMDVRVRKLRKPAIQETVIFEGSDIVLPDFEAAVEEIPQEKVNQAHVKIQLAPEHAAQNISIPEEKLIKAESQNEETQNGTTQIPIQDLGERSYIAPEAQSKEQVQATKDVSYNADLPFPIKPTEPNKVVGMVLSQNNDLLTNAIVEIQTLEGNIVRAVKSNALGQFFITTPLKPGDYNVIVEKNGYMFEPQHLQIDNSIVPPMEIRSQN